MNRKRTVRLLVWTIMLSILSIFQMGYANAYPNTAVNGFRVFLNESMHGTIDESTFSWMWSAILNVYFIGFITGSLTSIPIADRLGRKWCLVLGNVTNFISASLTTISIAYFIPLLFVMSRMIFAIGAGISMNSLILLLQESAPVSLRGLMSFNAEMAFVITNAFGALAGMRNVLGNSLVHLVGLACIPTLLSVIISLHFHESPRFLLVKRNERAKAEMAIKFYQGTDDQTTAAVLSTYEVESSERIGTIKELWFTKHLRTGLLLGIIALQSTTSIWPILYYSTDFLIRTNIAPEVAELTSTVMLLVSCFSTVIGMIIVERQPRRRLLIGCGFINMSALLLFVVCSQLQLINDVFKYGCIVAVVIHGISYSVALGPISWFITAELVPLQYRALCQSLALSSNQAIALVLCFISFPLYDRIGSLVLLPLFIIPGLAALAYLSWKLPETRSRNIDEIIIELKG